MKTILYKLDHYAIPINLTYQGLDQFSTKIGSLISVISYILILGITCIIGQDLVYKLNPSVLTTVEITSHHPDHLLTKHNFFYGAFMSDINNVPFTDKAVANLVSGYYTVSLGADGETLYKDSPYTIIPCSTLYQNTSDADLPVKRVILQPLSCAENLNISIGGFWTEQTTRYMYTEVIACVNDTNNINNPCKSSEEINSVINTLFLNIFYPLIVITPKNYTTPLSSFAGYDSYALSSAFNKEINYYFARTRVETDSNLIFSAREDEKEIAERIGFIRSVPDTQMYNGRSFAKCLFFADNRRTTVSRQYIKVTNIAANMGGIIQVIFLIFKILLSPLVYKLFNLLLVNEFFDFNEDNNINDTTVKNIHQKKDGSLFIKSGDLSMFNLKNLRQNNTLTVYNFITDKNKPNLSIVESIDDIMVKKKKELNL